MGIRNSPHIAIPDASSHSNMTTTTAVLTDRRTHTSKGDRSRNYSSHHAKPRASASRLWNPINSLPRTPSTSTLPLLHSVSSTESCQNQVSRLPSTSEPSTTTPASSSVDAVATSTCPASSVTPSSSYISNRPLDSERSSSHTTSHFPLTTPLMTNFYNINQRSVLNISASTTPSELSLALLPNVAAPPPPPPPPPLSSQSLFTSNVNSPSSIVQVTSNNLTATTTYPDQTLHPPPSSPPPQSQLQTQPHNQASKNAISKSSRALRNSSTAAIPQSLPSQPHTTSHTSATIAWGPLHPCYPHLNAHVPESSPLRHSTRVIRVKRDWLKAGDITPSFANVYPQVLDPLLPENEFRKIIQTVNTYLTEAFNPFTLRAWLDSALGVLTLWFWDDLGFTHVKSKLRALERWIDKWNETYGSKDTLCIIPLRKTAYMTFDIQIPDPQLTPDIIDDHPHNELTSTTSYP